MRLFEEYCNINEDVNFTNYSKMCKENIESSVKMLKELKTNVDKISNLNVVDESNKNKGAFRYDLKWYGNDFKFNSENYSAKDFYVLMCKVLKKAIYDSYTDIKYINSRVTDYIAYIDNRNTNR